MARERHPTGIRHELTRHRDGTEDAPSGKIRGLYRGFHGRAFCFSRLTRTIAPSMEPTSTSLAGWLLYVIASGPPGFRYAKSRLEPP